MGGGLGTRVGLPIVQLLVTCSMQASKTVQWEGLGVRLSKSVTCLDSVKMWTAAKIHKVPLSCYTMQSRGQREIICLVLRGAAQCCFS